MPSNLLVLGLIAISAFAFGQSTDVSVRSLPLPPVPTAATEKADSYLFQSSDTAEMRQKKRASITAMVSITASRLRDLNKEILTQRAPEAFGPPSVTNTENTSAIQQLSKQREETARELASWKRYLENFDLESQCGPLDDSQDVEFYDGTRGPSAKFVSDHEKAVVLIKWIDDVKGRIGPDGDPGNVAGVRWCSGTLIAPSKVLTARHCTDIDSGSWRTPRVNGTALPPEKLATLMEIEFNYQLDRATGELRTPVSYPVVALIERGNEQNKLDYAILEVGPGANGKLPGSTFPIAKTVTSETALKAADRLTVIQHPLGKPKRIDAGIGIERNPSEITYSDIDTLGGSSGAGVLDQNGQLVAVHIEGGCNANGGANVGVTMSAIAKSSPFFRK
ncbi:serine protease [Caballeronia sp. ATUFL_F2_KS9A]|uniref:trypsin-like serine peptidase n=1 Tax=Caballeronia sp. ATUFL_F2_KS9A TaxID=2921777 RepID=UPI0020295FB8|nr:serine protease [Caballeronia sp. ATUFL_F2_KS9A]